MLVNHPTVRDTSTPFPTSSRPCPSSAIRSFRCPLHFLNVSASPTKSTSLIWLRYTPGTSFNNALVLPASSLTSTCPTDSHLFPPTSLSRASFSCPPCTHSPTSPSTSFTFPFNASPHSRYELVFSPNSTASPRSTCSYPRCKSSNRIRHDTPSTTK